jgi:hypothetical protein
MLILSGLYRQLFFMISHSSQSSGCWAILCCEIIFHWMVLPVSVQSIFVFASTMWFGKLFHKSTILLVKPYFLMSLLLRCFTSFSAFPLVICDLLMSSIPSVTLPSYNLVSILNASMKQKRFSNSKIDWTDTGRTIQWNMISQQSMAQQPEDWKLWEMMQKSCL